MVLEKIVKILPTIVTLLVWSLLFLAWLCKRKKKGVKKMLTDKDKEFIDKQIENAINKIYSLVKELEQKEQQQQNNAMTILLWSDFELYNNLFKQIENKYAFDFVSSLEYLNNLRTDYAFCDDDFCNLLKRIVLFVSTDESRETAFLVSVLQYYIYKLESVDDIQ